MVSDSGNGSNRGKRTKAGLIACLIGAAIFAVSLIGWGLWKSAEYERQANANSGHYSEYTGRKIAETCVTTAPLEKAKCMYESRDKEREYRYNQNDLAAQRKSALWACIMGLAAVVGMALSALGVWLVKTTFDETRKANEIANEIHRPWLTMSMEPISFICFPDKHCFGVKLTLENVGDSVAIGVNFHGNIVEESAETEGAFWNLMEETKPQAEQSRVSVVPRDKFISQVNMAVTGEEVRLWASPGIINPVLIMTVFYRSKSDQKDWHKAIRAYRWTRKSGSFRIQQYGVLDKFNFILVPQGGNIAT